MKGDYQSALEVGGKLLNVEIFVIDDYDKRFVDLKKMDSILQLPFDTYDLSWMIAECLYHLNEPDERASVVYEYYKANREKIAWGALKDFCRCRGEYLDDFQSSSRICTGYVQTAKTFSIDTSRKSVRKTCMKRNNTPG